MTTLFDFPEPPKARALRLKFGPSLRDRVGVCPAIIAYELGISERTVLRLQRKLGLRACRPQRISERD